MNSIDRYVFRTTFSAFVVVLLNLTAVIWVTQILRQIDLITSQGQTVFVFLTVTSLIVPTLMLILAPISMVIAVGYTLVKLNNDSELVVMSAAGMSPVRLFRPFLGVALVVSLMVAFIAAYLSPRLQREMTERLTQIRADVVANVVRPGTFISIERGMTFHIREKQSSTQFAGVLIDDYRDPNERVTILADYGQIFQLERGTFLVMTDGVVQRRRANERDPTFVEFQRYAFDLSPYTAAGRVTFGLRERYFWELAVPDPDDPLLKTAAPQFRVEFHDRILAPLYPLAFIVIAFVVLCTPRTTRQGRVMSTVSVVVGVVLLRILGFACMNIGLRTPSALAVVYVAWGLVVALGLFAIGRGTAVEVENSLNFAGLRDRLLAKISRPAVRH
jgi:lipopolysaccharide export system permease protein